jgi:DNA-binding NtrC family response regulator
MTAFGNISDAVQAMKNGAYDYLVKGDDNEKIIPLVYRAIEKAKDNKSNNTAPVCKLKGMDQILGSAESILQAKKLAERVSLTDASVLLTGETGTGKEVFAHAIHETGSRNNKNFVAINCSAFSKEILESELFGHKQGAFTGAVRDKKGLVEEANGGTLFLDEIGEMPMDLQAKLLRVLETGEFIKMGETKVSTSNFRLIAATNRNLLEESRVSDLESQLAALSSHNMQLAVNLQTITNSFFWKVSSPIRKLLDKAKLLLELERRQQFVKSHHSFDQWSDRVGSILLDRQFEGV